MKLEKTVRAPQYEARSAHSTTQRRYAVMGMEAGTLRSVVASFSATWMLVSNGPLVVVSFSLL